MGSRGDHHRRHTTAHKSHKSHNRPRLLRTSLGLALAASFRSRVRGRCTEQEGKHGKRTRPAPLAHHPLRIPTSVLISPYVPSLPSHGNPCPISASDGSLMSATRRMLVGPVHPTFPNPLCKPNPSPRTAHPMTRRPPSQSYKAPIPTPTRPPSQLLQSAPTVGVGTRSNQSRSVEIGRDRSRSVEIHPRPEISLDLDSSREHPRAVESSRDQSRSTEIHRDQSSSILEPPPAELACGGASEEP
jgi:hypothetical protein